MPFLIRLTVIVALLLATGCSLQHQSQLIVRRELREIASSDHQWTGIAVSREGRKFVTFPRWNEAVSLSVAELLPNGDLRPFPDAEWNRWYGIDPLNRFVCAQSVHVDSNDVLWILDAANPRFHGVVAGGAKLLKIDLSTNRVAQVIRFSVPALDENSYLNDIRIDTRTGHALITDSGRPGLIVVHLATGLSWRVLDNDVSTRSEEISLSFNDRPWTLADGSSPRIHSDGIAIDPAGKYLYYKPLTGRILYRIRLGLLHDEDISAAQLPEKVERVAETVASDGLEFDREGRLYLTAIEEHAIKRLLPDGTMETVLRDSRLQWPDSLALAPDGSFLVTTSRIHLGEGPYKLFQFVP